MKRQMMQMLNPKKLYSPYNKQRKAYFFTFIVQFISKLTMLKVGDIRDGGTSFYFTAELSSKAKLCLYLTYKTYNLNHKKNNNNESFYLT
jgi:hypothetical protein